MTAITFEIGMRETATAFVNVSHQILATVASAALALVAAKREGKNLPAAKEDLKAVFLADNSRTVGYRLYAVATAAARKVDSFGDPAWNILSGAASWSEAVGMVVGMFRTDLNAHTLQDLEAALQGKAKAGSAAKEWHDAIADRLVKVREKGEYNAARLAEALLSALGDAECAALVEAMMRKAKAEAEAPAEAAA